MEIEEDREYAYLGDWLSVTTNTCVTKSANPDYYSLEEVCIFGIIGVINCLHISDLTPIQHYPCHASVF